MRGSQGKCAVVLAMVGTTIPTRMFTRKICSQENVMFTSICECSHRNVHGAMVGSHADHMHGCEF